MWLIHLISVVKVFKRMSTHLRNTCTNTHRHETTSGRRLCWLLCVYRHADASGSDALPRCASGKQTESLTGVRWLLLRIRLTLHSPQTSWSTLYRTPLDWHFYSHQIYAQSIYRSIYLFRLVSQKQKAPPMEKSFANNCMWCAHMIINYNTFFF